MGVAARLRRILSRAFPFVALVAVVNLALAPIVHAAASTHIQTSVSEVAAELKATFGDAFELCVNVSDDGSTPAPAHHVDGDCPLCCPHGAANLIAPEPQPFPVRFAVRRAAPPPTADAALPPPSRASPSQPRAPPLT